MEINKFEVIFFIDRFSQLSSCPKSTTRLFTRTSYSFCVTSLVCFQYRSKSGFGYNEFYKPLLANVHLILVLHERNSNMA